MKTLPSISPKSEPTFVADLACSRTRSMRVASHPAARAAHPGCRVRGARGTRSPRPCRRLLRARAAEAGRADPADRGARERADDVPAALRAWCAATRGGVDATVADIDALRRLVASAETASGSASDAAFAEPASSCLPEASSSPSPSSSSERWRLLGAAQRTEPSPGSWLASPFFWFAKEAQHESYEIAIEDYGPNRPESEKRKANATTRLAARLAAGWDDPKSGERWVTAFGAREATAAFPFSVVEGALNAFRVPFESGKATVTFTTKGENTRDAVMTLESRVRVRFGNPDANVANVAKNAPFFAKIARDGDLVTRCALETPPNANANERERTRTNAESYVVRLVSTAFENFGDDAFGRLCASFVVPSGAIMGALMRPSARARARNDASGKPGVPYRVARVGDVAVAVAGASEATETILVYERAEKGTSR